MCQPPFLAPDIVHQKQEKEAYTLKAQFTPIFKNIYFSLTCCGLYLSLLFCCELLNFGKLMPAEISTFSLPYQCN